MVEFMFRHDSISKNVLSVDGSKSQQKATSGVIAQNLCQADLAPARAQRFLL